MNMVANHQLLAPFQSSRRALFVVAAPIEMRAVLKGIGADPTLPTPVWSLVQATPRFDVALVGVSKANAAAGTALILNPNRHAAVVSVGIAGALPSPRGLLPNRSVVLATSCVHADEGMRTPTGFVDLAQMGFPLSDEPDQRHHCTPALVEALSPLADAAGPIATVSICSATDALAHEIADRTGAIAETMEGAAVALVATRLSVPFCELRTISNPTGDRSTQTWDIVGALARLAEVLGRV
jgi:futalosine hydrolase